MISGSLSFFFGTVNADEIENALHARKGHFGHFTINDMRGDVMQIATDRPLRGRRLTWAEFQKLTGRPKPEYQAANDNERKEVAA